MELFLNLTWIALAAALWLLFIRCSGGHGSIRRRQVMALLLVLVLLFPVISVTDDLVMAQNPTESDCCLRKGHTCPNVHLPLHPLAHLFAASLARTDCETRRFFAPGSIVEPLVSVAALESIENRPPPIL
jgi:hypothetical protein